MMTQPLTNSSLVERLAGFLPPDGPGAANVIVGIDGVDGAGKTILAERLVEQLRKTRAAVRVSIDGFHHTRDRRYQRGRSSPEGFWLDSYDYVAFHRELTEPFRAGSGTYLAATHDVDTDAVLRAPRHDVPRQAVLVVDGIFLHRPELRDIWDLTVYLDVPFHESARRMSRRDGSPPDPDSPENARYVGGQRIYLDECRPRDSATILVDYADVTSPVIMRWGHADPRPAETVRSP
ncbi:Thymidylate kinase [Microbacterium oxydans]|uniref:Thymidylate kinase n=2 Tax=Microbacterium oxydans TaxID=82380 RepID=A0A0F0LEE7_9MICO|nr:Thymidylate kinase [Microbacterium oxydans]